MPIWKSLYYIKPLYDFGISSDLILLMWISLGLMYPSFICLITFFHTSKGLTTPKNRNSTISNKRMWLWNCYMVSEPINATCAICCCPILSPQDIMAMLMAMLINADQYWINLAEPRLIIPDQNQHSFFNNCLIFNPKPPLESLEPQLCL